MPDFPPAERNRYAVKRNFYPEDYGAVGDVVELQDCSITNGTATLDSAAYTFVAADVGKYVLVQGAGAAGANLLSTISSISSGNAVLADNASTTVTTTGIARFGTNDTTAVQACVDDALISGEVAEPTIWLRGAYLLQSAPRTDRKGNCIVSVLPPLASAQGYALGSAIPNLKFEGVQGVQLSSNYDYGFDTFRTTDSYLSSIASTLSAQLTAGATTASLTSAASFPTSGTAVVNDGGTLEVIQWTGKSTNDLTGLTRGKFATTDRTNANGSTITLTYGPPSVFGGATREQITDGTATYAFVGNVSFKNLFVRVPPNPAISGIDGISFAGNYYENIDVRSGMGYETLIAPTNKWTFGIRMGTLWGSWNPTLKSTRSRGFYAGFVLPHNDHAIYEKAYPTSCVVAIALQDPWEGGGGHPARGYWLSSGFNYLMAGWNATAGAHALPDGSVKVWWGTQVVSWETASDPFGVTSMILDTNGQIYGRLEFCRFAVIGGHTTVPTTDSPNIDWVNVRSSNLSTRRIFEPEDGDVGPGELGILFDSTTSNTKMKIKAKDSAGTVYENDLPLAGDGTLVGIAPHGATAGYTRPTGFTVVVWVGTVEPTNAVNGDIWVDTT